MFMKYYTSVRQLQNQLQQFCAIVRSFNRRAELTRLVSWAKRKRYAGPRRHYEKRLAEEDLRISIYMTRFTTLSRYARLVYQFNCLISPLSYVPAKGSGAVYRRKQ